MDKKTQFFNIYWCSSICIDTGRSNIIEQFECITLVNRTNHFQPQCLRQHPFSTAQIKCRHRNLHILSIPDKLCVPPRKFSFRFEHPLNFKTIAHEHPSMSHPRTKLGLTALCCKKEDYTFLDKQIPRVRKFRRHWRRQQKKEHLRFTTKLTRLKRNVLHNVGNKRQQ